MRVKALVVVAALAAVGWPAASLAEKVKTNQDTKVHSRAGEQAPVVMKITSGKTVTVLTRDGRWVKIRVSGRTGWVPRSKLDLPEGDDEIARNTRRRAFVDGRGTRRGFGGEAGPDDRVGADAVGDGSEDDGRDSRVSRPSRDDTEDSEERPTRKKPARDKPEREKPEKPEKPEKVAREKPEKPAREKPEKPTKASKPAKVEAEEEVVSVEDDDTDPENAPVVDAAVADTAEAPPSRPMAHVAKRTRIHVKADAESDEAFVADAKTPLFVGKTKGEWTKVSTDDGDAGYVLTSKLDIEGEAGEGGARRRKIEGRGRLGITLVKQSLSTPGMMNNVVPDNYSASSSSFTIALGGSVLYPYKERLWYGGELSYDFNKAVPGISYSGQTIGFSYHVLNLRAVGGYDLQNKSAMTIYARFGLHYDSFQIGDVGDYTKNTAKLPNQIIAGPTLGAALGIGKLTPKLGLIVALDIMPTGSLSQTKNLEDGTDPSVKGFFLGGRLLYHWKPKMDIQFTYDMMYEPISFGGMAPAGSQRGHMGTGPSKGSDFNNAVSGGISYAF